MLKFIALCLRCQKRFASRKRKSKQDSLECSFQTTTLEPLTCQELNNAERELIKFDQNRAFAEEIEAIGKGSCVKKSSALTKLDPILVDGLLRVGRRLSRAPLSDDSKHQIIIAKDSSLARLLVNHFQQKSGYSGREYVLSLLRERFWLIRANSTARSVHAFVLRRLETTSRFCW